MWILQRTRYARAQPLHNPAYSGRLRIVELKLSLTAISSIVYDNRDIGSEMRISRHEKTGRRVVRPRVATVEYRHLPIRLD